MMSSILPVRSKITFDQNSIKTDECVNNSCDEETKTLSNCVEQKNLNHLLALVDKTMAHLFFYNTKVSLQAPVVGGKAANLQKLGQIKGIDIPKWFVLSTRMMKQYLLDNQVFHWINELNLLCLDLEKNYDKIVDLSKNIKEKILKGAIRLDDFAKNQQAYEELKRIIGKPDPHFAVRSSGVMEDDGISSCAGLYDTLLNRQGMDQIFEAIKVVWASSFNMGVIQERVHLGLNQLDCLMGVIVQEQIHSRASGVASTIVLSNHFPGIQIAANYGIGESVVNGDVTADSWIVHPTKGYILEAIKGKKETSCILGLGKGTKKIDVAPIDRDKFVLHPEEIREIARQVAHIKNCYACKVDVEFALDQQEKLFLLQARPLVMVKTNKILVIDSNDAKKHQEIAKGLYSLPGVASGKLVFIHSWEDLASGKIKLTKEDIALAFITTNVWSQFLTNIKGLITREGSPSSHPILLCREKKIPCLIGIDHAFEELIKYNGCEITIDGFNKVIYEGVVVKQEANFADIIKRFEPIKMRKWPKIEEALPHLLHNQMVVSHEGKFWRRTPTYPVSGFQLELNMKRFAVVPQLLGKEGKVEISAKVINGYTCNELVPFEEYVSLFEELTIKEAEAFNKAQEQCMKEFFKIAETFVLDPSCWQKYIEVYARLRAFIWLGGAYRCYAERQVDEIGVTIELPSYYLDECEHALQSGIPEIDMAMHKDIYMLAERLKEKLLPEHIEDLKESDPLLFFELVELSKKYRFEHIISLDVPVDLNLVYKRIVQEVEGIRSGNVFTTSKYVNERNLLPENHELKSWLKLSIWNRILQSDAHHLDARAKKFVRSKLLELGKYLVEKESLNDSKNIFTCSIDQIAEYMTAYCGKNR